MPEDEFIGTVVEQDPDSPLRIDTAHDGLYLLAKNGQLFKLVSDPMFVQMSVEALWRKSRSYFEQYLGKEVTVQGYRSGSTIFGALVKSSPG